MKDILIIGAGAMGCLFAARLAKAGANVTLLDVDVGRVHGIEREGLVLIDDQGTSAVRPRAALAKDHAGPADLVVLFTKGYHSASAVQSIAHLVPFAPVALTLQNGIGNAEILAETFGADHVLMGTAHVPADLQLPNRVISHGFAHIHLGGFNRAAQAHAPEVAALLGAGGFDAIVAETIEVAVWEKLAFNAALNALAMVARATNGEMNNEPGLRIAYAIVAETVAVAQAKGIGLDGAAIAREVARAVAEHAGHKASMLQDREAGRQTEIEFINGAVVREGVRHGIATPVAATLTDLVRLIEANEATARLALAG